MVYNLNGKNIKIPDADIKKNIEALEVNQEEAIQIWLEDEGYLENEEQEALCKKAKENRITATIHQASAKTAKKKTQKERVKKEDATKEMVIAEIAQLLPKFAENVQILNAGKLISFTIGADSFEIDLKRKRKSKK
jgi:hydroxymethylpyrimidine pyrophosphatase-like HAD family hydrolase